MSYSTSKGGSYTSRTTTKWSVNAFWTGGYEDECRWHGKVMEAPEAPRLGVVSTALGLVFGVLAVAVKLHIIAALEPPVSQVAEPPDDRPSPEPGAGGAAPGADDQAASDPALGRPPLTDRFGCG